MSQQARCCSPHAGPVTFAGGQIAWAIYYTLDKAAYAVFAFDSCNRGIAMTVTLSNSSTRTLAALELVLPASAMAICDGPAFSSRDRADAAVPLR